MSVLFLLGGAKTRVGHAFEHPRQALVELHLLFF
jgi:hypothetical protein